MKKLFILVAILAISLTSCQMTDIETSNTESSESLSTNNSSENNTSESNTSEEELLGYEDFLSEDNPVVVIKVKNFGTMEVELFPTVAENTVNNFISYVESGSYTNSTFHRVIETFMIQGGIVSDKNSPIKGEFYSNGVINILPHYRGVISMARTNDMNSATSQFFIMHADAGYLNNNYASFGGLISGFDILDEIATTETVNDSPINDIIIESVTVELNGYIPSDVIYVD